MNNDLISIIVPIYKVEEFLCRCIDSILAQTYNNIEIILVDDGSPDNCGSICDAYSMQDNRVRVIHKENGGLSDARNAGIEIAKGAWITCVDSDDFVAENYIEELVYGIEITGADMSMVGVEIIHQNEVTYDKPSHGHITTITKKDAIVKSLQREFRQSAWGKLYKRSIFKDIRYPKGLLYEDLAVIYNILDKVETIAISDARLYKYLIREGSIMQSQFNIHQYNSLVVTDKAMDFVIERYPEYQKEANGRRVYSYFTVLKRMLSSQDKNEYVTQVNDLKKRIKMYSKGLIFDRRIKKSLKMRILAFLVSDHLYITVEHFLYKRIEAQNG